jgi:hypothetical protein
MDTQNICQRRQAPLAACHRVNGKQIEPEGTQRCTRKTRAANYAPDSKALGKHRADDDEKAKSICLKRKVFDAGAPHAALRLVPVGLSVQSHSTPSPI